MKLVRMLLVVGLFLLFAIPASAGKRAGVSMPDRITVEGKTLVLNGMGVREATFLNIDVYVAGLYLENKSSNAREIINSEKLKRIHMHFVRNVDRSDITDAWSEGFKKNAGKNLGALKSRIARLNGWMTDIKNGQTLTFTYVPGKGVQVHVKGSYKGTIPGADFARVFISIWLGPHPPNKGLKKGMLGKG